MGKPPSKLRYEATHPQVSFRIDHDTKEWLDGIRAKTGQSYSSILQDALISAAKWREYSERRYIEGYEDGKREFHIQYRCGICGGLCTVQPNSNAHQEIVNCLASRGWGHAECHERRRRGM